MKTVTTEIIFYLYFFEWKFDFLYLSKSKITPVQFSPNADFLSLPEVIEN